MLRRRPPVKTALVLVFLITISAAVSMTTSIAPAQEESEQVAIHIYQGDFDFVLDRTIVPAGPIEFDALNISPTYKHEVWIYPIDERDSPRFQEMLNLKRTGQRADEADFIDGIVLSSGEV